MISYELAKQLKEAGFRQPDRHEMYLGLFKSPEGIDGSFAPDSVYFPALEELIEACGEDLWAIEHLTTWIARSKTAPTFHARGSTPTEAVAMLWLALNKPVTDQGGEVIK